MKTTSLTLNLTGPEPKSSLSVFHHGQAFFLAGSRCLQPLDIGPGVTQCLVSPGVVNLCLAVELFLKSLLLLENGDAPKIHKLQDLFAQASTSDRDAIRAGYEGIINGPAFDDLVATINDYFVKVRYGYEFDIFSFNEVAVYHLARELYVHTAKRHEIKPASSGSRFEVGACGERAT